MFPEGIRYIDQAALGQADPVSLKVALMAITNGGGLIVAPAAPPLFFKLLDGVVRGGTGAGK